MKILLKPLLLTILFLSTPWHADAEQTGTGVVNYEQPHPGLPPGKMLNTFSSDPYEIKINAHRLMVPMNHLKGITTKNFVGLFARWPGMKPYQQGMGSAPYDDIEILVDGVFMGRSSGEPADGHGRAKSEKGLLPPVMNKELGLWEYRLANPTPRPWYYVADVTRIGPDGKRRAESELISCASSTIISGDYDTLQCSARYFVRNDVNITYRFAHKHIADWQAIDREVRKLVESTFVKNIGE